MKYAKGIMWLDDCRIPFLTDEGYNYKNGPKGNSFSVGQEPDGKRTEPVESNPLGRFTPNLLVCDDMLNDGTITKATAAGKKGKSGFVNGYESGDYDIPYGDKGTNSRYYDLDKWFNKMIDEIR